MNNWINYIDKLPNDYEEVLYFAINDIGTTEIMTGHRQNGEWTHCCLFYSTRILDNRIVNVTHWMPLPEPPAHEK